MWIGTNFATVWCISTYDAQVTNRGGGEAWLVEWGVGAGHAELNIDQRPQRCNGNAAGSTVTNTGDFVSELMKSGFRETQWTALGFLQGQYGGLSDFEPIQYLSFMSRNGIDVPRRYRKCRR